MSFRKYIRKKFLFTIGLTLLLLALIAGAISFFSQKPPTGKIEAGRKAIAEAIKEEANIYSIAELTSAEKNWESAMNEWKENNGKSPIVRNYEKTIVFADLAIVNAIKAKKNAIKRKVELRKEVEKGIASLRVSINYIETAKEKLPVNHSVWKKYTPVALKLDEVESAFKRNDLTSAKKGLDSIYSAIDQIKKETKELLENYFSSYDKWIKLDAEMRHLSRVNNSVSLVVEKFSRRCIVYKSGRKIKEYSVELGVNWLGDKNLKGDRATPEGKYSITAKKSGRSTIYHKALMINFPNAEDRRRFKTKQANGNIPKNANIGGLIEIHGGGGKGIDWTDGCVALTNRDMDNLYSLCSVGTPIAIIGSLTSMDKIFDLTQN
ncbi:MAG: hypothetical protein A2X18_01140 [Bacteroidetes bacterium GWF2_40_14]|nr:MAG: hypothetical protein A2X18_01140 [Bacteroidetes bacterium GWF2_40_14]